MGSTEIAPEFVVGIGASAGGLEALQALFANLPPRTGMAFVVVQHLSAEFKSVMDELLSRHTEMPVRPASNGMRVERDMVYVIPSGKQMIISGGRLLLSDKDPNERLSLPIDHFFRSLAHDCGERAVAIVLSGSGSDGSRGILEVHNQGGHVIAQDPSTAAFESMPMAAKHTGVLSATGSPENIADYLLRLAQAPLPSCEASSSAGVFAPSTDEMLESLQNAYGIDFRLYKPAMVTRRIARRIQLNNLSDTDSYSKRIQTDAHEMDRLYRDLLIGVTEFFRDTDAFKLLEEKVIPDILLRVPADQELRFWVAGCATGEEAYSLAILVHERLKAMNRHQEVRIFATDVHPGSLDVATLGIYSEDAMRNISATRHERYFTRCEDAYRVTSEIRGMVVFAPHNLMKNAPFTRLDLVTCRNLLIYLEPLAQKKVLSLFHFALKAGGTLFLGPSETTGELADEFDVVNAHWRVYRKKRDVRLTPRLEYVSPTHASRTKSQSREIDQPAPRAIAGHEHEIAHLHEALLLESMPASLVIDRSYRLVYSFGNVSELLRVPVGRATTNALDLLPTDVKTIVVGAIQCIARSQQPVAYDHVAVDTPHGQTSIKVTVKPLNHRLLENDY
ncbi:MAG: hypothetical protein KDA60_11045, partial [Planctomycetales bacterium]|nr:hypothetical protein [Planctomycetales bacterium]